jgi:hypothetical protein
MMLPLFENVIESKDMRSSREPVGMGVVMGRKDARPLLSRAVAGRGLSKVLDATVKLGDRSADRVGGEAAAGLVGSSCTTIDGVGSREPAV